MERIYYIDHNKKTILLIDLSHSRPAELQPIVEQVKKIVAHQSPGTVLTLTNVTEMLFDTSTDHLLKDLAGHNRLFTKAEAVVGAVGILKVIFETIAFQKKNNQKSFADMKSAKDWLAGQ